MADVQDTLLISIMSLHDVLVHREYPGVIWLVGVLRFLMFIG